MPKCEGKVELHVVWETKCNNHTQINDNFTPMITGNKYTTFLGNAGRTSDIILYYV